jgi:hypothetical protein
MLGDMQHHHQDYTLLSQTITHEYSEVLRWLMILSDPCFVISAARRIF